MARKKRKRSNGGGSIQQQGQSWRLRWREDGQRRSASFPDKETAERVLKRIVGDLAAGRGSLMVAKPASPPLSKLGDDWLKRREITHRSWRDDRNRWKKHVEPFFGHMLPNKVKVADVRRFVEEKLDAKLAPASIHLCVALLSSLYTDLVEQQIVEQNVVRGLPRSVRRLMKPAGAFSPFLEKQADIGRLYRELPQPYATIFAVGVLAGLRPGEVLALEWGDVDGGRIQVKRQVRNGRVGLPKSGGARTVPISAPLSKILTEWRLFTGGKGQLFQPANPTKGGRPGAPARFINIHTVWKALRAALKACELPETLTLYACTRHTFAAQHVLGGGSLSALRELLGHSSTAVTERYGRLRSDMLRPEALPTISVDLSRPRGEVVHLASHRDGARGTTVGLDEGADSQTQAASS